ncbi:hypothetical protein AAVH_42004, partial [Aphelenchoides avenae]
VGKCSGCQKTVLLGELFRCKTCKENSASAADAEIRVCGTCVAKSHKGHDYQELDVASKADFGEVREKIVGYKMASDAEKAILQMRKCHLGPNCRAMNRSVVEKKSRWLISCLPAHPSLVLI